MNVRSRFAFVLVAIAALGGCGEKVASDLDIERLPDVNPSLPDVPQLPPPPHEVQYSDGCFSVYGVRRRSGTTMDTDVCVTGYIVDIYQPPECPEGRTCDPPAAPHLWVADARDAGEDDDRIMVAGYAENQQQIDEAVEQAERGRYEPPDPESGLLPIPTDFAVGSKIENPGPLHADELDGLQREQRPGRLPRPRDARAAPGHRDRRIGSLCADERDAGTRQRPVCRSGAPFPRLPQPGNTSYGSSSTPPAREHELRL